MNTNPFKGRYDNEKFEEELYELLNYITEEKEKTPTAIAEFTITLPMGIARCVKNTSEKCKVVSRRIK